METQKLLELAKLAALEAGAEVMKIYNTDFDIEIKSDNSPVTQADKAANEILIKHLSQSDILILSEETKDTSNRLENEFLWIIDPIDGTKDFINKTGEFSIMIGLVQNGKPVLGVVYLPVLEKMYFAQVGKGSFLTHAGETKELQCSHNEKELTIMMSRNHTSPQEQELVDKMNIQIIKSGSIGVKLGVIAEGNAELYINLSNKTKQWDTCGPELILKEAGGIVTDSLGNDLGYNTSEVGNLDGVIATNGPIHDTIIQFINNN